MILKNQSSVFRIPLSKIRSLFLKILQELKMSHADFDLTFVGDARIRKLNKKFRGIDRATDVLSFPLWEPADIPSPLWGEGQGEGKVFLGDIVISVPTTLRQAKEHGKKPMEEIIFLSIHGLLHLLGYDHEISLKEEKRMQRMEKRLMKAIEDKMEKAKKNF